MPGSVTHLYVATGTNANNGEVDKSEWNDPHVLVGIPYVADQSAIGVSVGATTAETVLATITIPAGAVGPNGSVQIMASWVMNNSANNKTCAIYIGNTSGTPMHSSTHASKKNFATTKILMNANSASSQKANSPTYWYGPPQESTDDPFTSTVNTAAAWDIIITGQKANSGDTLTLDMYHVLITYGA